MDKYLEEVKSTAIFSCFCMSMKLDCLDLIYIMRPPTAHGHSDIFACIFLCYRPRFVRNEDVLDLDTRLLNDSMFMGFVIVIQSDL